MTTKNRTTKKFWIIWLCLWRKWK